MSANETARLSDARRRAPDEDTILRVAAEMFASKGYTATTMDGLAEALNITKPTLYVHGRSKSDILVRLVDRFVDEAERRLNVALAEGDDEQWIGRLLRLWVELSVTMRPHQHAFLNLRHEFPPDALARYNAWARRADRRIRATIARNQAAGQVRPDLDPDVIGYTVLALCNWTARWFNERGRLSIDQVVDGYMVTLIEGLKPTS
jgi:AcrR family transcriptional regulator